MNVVEFQDHLVPDQAGQEIYQLMHQLYPICRSITGNGFRETLRRLNQVIPLTVHEVPTGTTVFDWTVPKEWNIRDAYIKDPQGRRIVDFQKSNLHVVNYSVPVRSILPLESLRPHLFSLPDRPDWIPYRTSYYKETWGFCLSHRRLLQLEDGDYEVCIDSSLEDGYLTYGEYLVQGETPQEVLISCHACHPAMCNDNLSGVVLAAFLAKHLTALSLRYSYRFLFIPGTIGSITWLCRNEQHVRQVKHGLVLASVGDSGKSTYKKSRRGDAPIDRAVRQVLRHSGKEYEVMEFSPYGYDERQYCSPGFNLPVGCLSRTPHGRYPEYHTSADDLSFVQPSYLADSFQKCFSIFAVLENDRTYLNLNPKGEPQLGRRGIYRAIGGQNAEMSELAMLWVLNLSDGNHSLLQISEKSDLPFPVILNAARILCEHELLKEMRSQNQ